MQTRRRRLDPHRIRLVDARGVLGRLRGLLCRASPPGPRAGLRLSPCWAVHTIGMRYPIDVAFVNRNGRVRRLVRYLNPGRVAFSIGACSVIELAVNTKDSPLRYQRRLRLAIRHAQIDDAG
ncbi:hypothetical protein [Bordetella tumulicola]|uniref:hypothetical protein n=1 Tax=Bordetella tumulicola TaxID=1649133 RepID=UPI0039F06C37